MAQRSELENLLADWLEVARFRDYGPNGLQVEGKPDVRKIVSGVTASLALIEAAVAARADAVLVHHGLFWKGHDGRVTGWLKRRLALLMAHDISLFAYHLPLDAHPEFGNNAQFGARLGWLADARFGEQELGFIGATRDAHTLDAVAAQLLQLLGRTPTVVAGDGRPLRRVAWCTGEISEPQAHYARETGVAFIACGHHASERFGAPALGERVAQQFGITHEFIEIGNPA